MIALTPRLFVGDPGDEVWLSDLRRASTPAEAVTLIRDGQSALLGYEDWQEQARDVLGLLGVDLGTIEWAIPTAPRVNEGLEKRWPDAI
jgi:hypothetical protein